MKYETRNDHARAPGERELYNISSISIDTIEGPPQPTEVKLPSGRLMDIASSPQGDRIEIRSLTGDVVLRVLVSDEGPIFSFKGGQLELAADSDLKLKGRRVIVAAREDMLVEVGGDRHSRVAGADRVEAAKIEMQANEERVAIRARENVAIDAEHIGLNDEPLPAPFSWSKAAEEQ